MKKFIITHFHKGMTKEFRCESENILDALFQYSLKYEINSILKIVDLEELKNSGYEDFTLQL